MQSPLYLLLVLLSSVQAASYAICGSVGCLVTETLPSLAIGAKVSPKSSSNISFAWLLSGTYTSGYPTLSGQPSLLDAFLGSTSQQTASGFSFASANGAIIVDLTGSVLAFGKAFFTGAIEPAIGSFILSPTASAVLKVANGPISSISVFSSCSDTTQLGFGSKAVFTVDSSTSAPCQAGQYGTSNNCQACISSCATCWGPSSRQCLSCASGQRLIAGACRPTQCAGGATLLADLGICLEELDTFHATRGASSRAHKECFDDCCADSNWRLGNFWSAFFPVPKATQIQSGSLTARPH